MLATSGGRTAAGPRSTPSSSTASSAIPSRLPPPCWPWPRSPAPASTRRPACSPRSSAQPTPWSPATVTGCGSSLACCGVYARYDALPGSLDGNVIDTGTTNVDFNPPMRDALARIGGLEPLHLQVGEDVVVCTRRQRDGEEGSCLSGGSRGSPRSSLASATVTPVFEVAASEARRFIRGLPGSGSRKPVWVVPAGRGLRITTRPTAEGVSLRASTGSSR